MDIYNKDSQYIANTYKRYKVCFTSGKGVLVTDNTGKEYIDFSGGIAVNIFGLCDTEWQQAVIDQTNKLSHMSNLYYTEPCVKLAEVLIEKSGMSKVFFANSGAEANECAIKCARKYSNNKYGNNRYEIITLKNSFHGRTMATISATGQEVFHKDFYPFVEGFKFAEPTYDSIINNISEFTSAVMIELVQGEGGVNVLDQQFVRKLAIELKKRDILLIIDEVQTGNGRCGAMYCYLNYGITPDIITTAKGLGGGLPIGATIFGEKVAEVMDYSSHGSTFGGNPIVCAGALSIVNRIDDKLCEEVIAKGEYIKQALLEHNGVTGISGMGLMIGISTTKPAPEIVNLALEQGLILLTAKDKVRLLPALNITYAEIDRGIKILKEIL